MFPVQYLKHKHMYQCLLVNSIYKQQPQTGAIQANSVGEAVAFRPITFHL